MKKAKATIHTVWLECPYCGGDVSSVGGEQSIDFSSSDVLTCDDCGKEVSMPSTAK